MNLKKKEYLKIFLTIFIVILLIANSLVYSFRIDATQGQIYTFSKASKQILKEIPDNVNLTYYRSDSVRKIPYLARNLNLIEDQLNEIRRLSKNKISIKIIDPIKENELEKMQMLGIPGQQISQKTTGSATQNLFYTGIHVEYGKESAVIPFVFDTNSMEYELIRTIRKLTMVKDTKLAVLFGSDSSDIGNVYPVIGAVLQEREDWEIIDSTVSSFADYSGMLVVGGKNLDDADLVFIDQFIMHGKPVVMAVDILEVDLANQEEALNPEYLLENEVFNFLEKYGIKVLDSPLLDESSKKITQLVPMGGGYGFPNDYFSLRLLPEYANQKHPLFMNFGGLGMQWAGAFELELPEYDLKEEKDSKLLPLLTTTNKSWLAQYKDIIDPRYWQELQQSGYIAKRSTYNTAIAAQGYFESAYKGQDIPAKPGEDPIFESLVESSDDINFVVFSDTTFLSGLVQYMNMIRPSITMMQNIYEWLSNDEVLMKVRLKENQDMSLEKIQDLEKAERLKKATTWMNIFVIPMLVLISMIVVLIIRSRKKNRRLA